MKDNLNLTLINAVILYAANGPHRDIRLTDPLLDIAESGLDSMDVAVISGYLCELFDVPLAQQKDIPTHTVASMFEFLQQHGRRHINSVEEVQNMLAP